MRKSVFGICLSLVVAIVLLAAFVPSCTPTTQGTIEVNATSCGSPWTGNVSYTLTPASGSPVNGNNVTATFSVATGTWTCAYVSGGPGGAYFLKSITSSATQTVVANQKTTFTLNFELKQDAAIQWSTWTVNGQPIPGSEFQAVPCQIIDAHFLQWVLGCTGYNVTMNETSVLSITQTLGPPATIIVVDDWCAVNKTPAVRQKVSQVPSFNGVPVQKGMNITLAPQGAPTMLDVKTVWKLVKGTNYTKSINWFGISLVQIEPGAHPCVLFELVLPMPGQLYQFQLQSTADVALVDDVDVNPGNNHVMGPVLLLTVNLGP
jgi:hypothetical protein